jgi:hypothetical protein
MPFQSIKGISISCVQRLGRRCMRGRRRGWGTAPKIASPALRNKHLPQPPPPPLFRPRPTAAEEANLSILVVIACGLLWFAIVLTRMCDLWQLHRARREREVRPAVRLSFTSAPLPPPLPPVRTPLRCLHPDTCVLPCANYVRARHLGCSLSVSFSSLARRGLGKGPQAASVPHPPC